MLLQGLAGASGNLLHNHAFVWQLSLWLHHNMPYCLFYGWLKRDFKAMLLPAGSSATCAARWTYCCTASGCSLHAVLESAASN